MLTASDGKQYLYDALDQRMNKVGGAIPGETIYFGGRSLARYNTASKAWTDLIWAGNNMFATVAGVQTAAPIYRLLDHEGSLDLLFIASEYPTDDMPDKSLISNS